MRSGLAAWRLKGDRSLSGAFPNRGYGAGLVTFVKRCNARARLTFHRQPSEAPIIPICGIPISPGPYLSSRAVETNFEPVAVTARCPQPHGPGGRTRGAYFPTTTPGVDNMRYRKFGRTGLFVSELCLGTMTFGGEDGVYGQIGNLRQVEADRLIARSVDAGINLIDTADVYADGRSEIITGQALKNLQVPRENVVVASKVFGDSGTKGVNSRGLSRYHIMEGVQASLKRLQLDHLDLYQ